MSFKTSVRRAFMMFAGFVALLAGSVPGALAQTVVTSEVTLGDTTNVVDQDDMCIWIHPTDRSLSTVIASDKGAKKLFVYDLQGVRLQTIPIVGQPGNIDVRYHFPIAGGFVDIVVVNNRDTRRIFVYQVDPGTRQLTRVDNGALITRDSYGSCLYKSPVSGSYYVFTTAESGGVEQHVLQDQAGQVTSTRVRSWQLGGRTEGCVCDDENGTVYFGEETVGIWKFLAEPGDTTGTLVAAVGDSGLVADVEGLTIYYAAGGGGYLLASSQGSDDFKVYNRQAPHSYVGTFEVIGVRNTDGIDVTNVSLGPEFPNGIFVAHNGRSSLDMVEVCAYEDLQLQIDTSYWNPRGGEPTADAPLGDAGVVLHHLRAQPNPARQRLAISFSLRDARPAFLELFDLAGRRLWSTRVEAIGQGSHKVVVPEDVAMRAGSYLIRLTQGSTSFTSRAIVVR
ncbi:MAG TPA: phytase [Candidatus Limnocylindria bacterium]|nr:phytase [Candidatus Limnocylindria bacterium]